MEMQGATQRAQVSVRGKVGHPLVGVGLFDGKVGAVIAGSLLQHAQQPAGIRAALHGRHQLRARPRERQQRHVWVPRHPQAARTLLLFFQSL